MIRHPVSNITKQHLAVLTLVELVLDRKDLTHSRNKIKLWVLNPMDLTRTGTGKPMVQTVLDAKDLTHISNNIKRHGTGTGKPTVQTVGVGWQGPNAGRNCTP